MKENAETKTKRQQKLDFITQQMPELVGNKNIHTDANLLLKAERILFEGGFYKEQRYYEGRKASVLRLCVEASLGKRPKSNLVIREDRSK